MSFRVLFRHWCNGLGWCHFTAWGSDTLLWSTSAWQFTRYLTDRCWVTFREELCKYRNISMNSESNDKKNMIPADSNSHTSYIKILTAVTFIAVFFYLNDFSCNQTWTSAFPRQNIHPCATEGAVSVSLSAVQNLLQLFVSRLLGFHSHLPDQNKYVAVCLHFASMLINTTKCSWNYTSRMVISFSFSFPALFFTWVFLVSTHTTLSFTSDLETHTHAHRLVINLPEIAF